MAVTSPLLPTSSSIKSSLFENAPLITLSIQLKRRSGRSQVRSVTPASSTMEHQTDNHPPSSSAKRVVVCGGGVIGVCTAYFLAKKGVAVTLVEKSSIACAASGKAGGFLALDWCDGGALSNLARASFSLHRSLAQELDGPRSYGYRPLNTLSLSFTESQQKQTGIAGASTNSIIPSWVDGPAKNPRTIGTTSTTAQVSKTLI